MRPSLPTVTIEDSRAVPAGLSMTLSLLNNRIARSKLARSALGEKILDRQ
ncbi:hypothetical protein FOQG_04203 [Fusarium oxysporum f. sp. raphani 54005]|uniref:Uncharacterized protein n=1 Tax=Fusarium oxysporum f. sp. raphani 54005 TaxID=1089458 RepID=X0CWH9_FUSOX|nr:hypothetical protein FOQG_04203 [Fusarium oxysporum f. sp. raphani 54005]